KVEWIYSKKGLVQKIILEKSNPVADIFLSSDISRLIDISEAGASVKIQPLSTVPTNLQSDYWAGLTQRARIIYVNKDLNIKNINYEDLAHEDYKGKICVRSGFHPYNISLFASLMAHHSEEWLETYLTDLKANLARKPQGNDRDQVKAIYAGVCDYSIGNHYYFFKMQDNDDQKVWLDKATVVFPNQENRGTHVNISGIAILNPNKLELAEKLVHFLAGKKAQSIYANDNNEFPVSPEVSVSEKVKKLAGNAKFDSLDLEKLASNRKAVINLLNKINFDE
ncbi:ABC transporter substrate-binding protein, partial [Alphaproteobacteria bacterium]|nr:ABC transporter substrate-binding protein [Alphaproteobacteria bacterium]